MNDVFRPYLYDFVLVYWDDSHIFSKNKDQHSRHLHIVLDYLCCHQLYAQPSMCQFFRDEVTYLGHIVGKGGLRVDTKKVATVQNWSAPQDVGHFRSFLGLTNYFRTFLMNY